MRCWECVAYTAERAIATVRPLATASISSRRPSIEARAWKALSAGDAAQELSLLILAVRNARSGRARKKGRWVIAAPALSSPAPGYRLSRTTDELTTAMCWPSLRNCGRMVLTAGWPNKGKGGCASAGPGSAGTKRFASTAAHLCSRMHLFRRHGHSILGHRTQTRQPRMVPKQISRHSGRGGEV